ncbi:uncharacterized protein LOC120359423 [Solenopsis invicta]|uniref:uncharacterized protein LOC120359423 n=1 Tax=Solenopsis invicta TaxID=13686 RepID=UPI00193E27F7|nr:uncharacterized protein LOC120359423 [Solenopsis invicta]
MANYYVPIQTEACEKSTLPHTSMNYYIPIQTEACEKSTPPRYTSHILGRRFALTPTSYKWLDIGINAGSISYVELVLGDNRGNQIALPYKTWRSLIEKRMDIEGLMQSKTAPLLIHELIVQQIKLHEEHIIKLTLHNTYICMKPATVSFMFELEHCIEHVYFTLCQNMNNVTDKYKHFITYLRQNCITNKNDAVNILRKIYDKSSHIECELIAYASNNIAYDSLNDK